MNKKITVLSILCAAVGFTYNTTRTTEVTGWVEAEWQDCGTKKHFKVETSVVDVKNAFQDQGLSTELMKVNVHGYTKNNDYLLQQGDIVKVWPTAPSARGLCRMIKKQISSTSAPGYVLPSPAEAEERRENEYEKAARK